MANFEWQKIATKEYIDGAFFDFNFEHESENGLIKIQMIDKLGNVIEKTITINSDKYINSVVYEGENKQFRFTFTDGTSIVCPFSVDLSNYPTKDEVNAKQDIITDLDTIRQGAALGATALQTHQDISHLVDKTTQQEKDTYQDKEINELKKENADLKEALFGYVLDKNEVEIESTIPSTTEVNGTTYNLCDNVRGLVKSVNGKTIKSENLLVLEDVEETTTNGITYSVKNGIITLNGTATSNVNIWIPISKISSNTQISYKNFPSLVSYGDNKIQLFLAINSGNYSNRFTLYKYTSEYSGTTQYEYNTLHIYINNEITINNLDLKPMLVKGTTAPTGFKQGFDGLKSVEYERLEIKGKNLLDIPLTQGFPSNTDGADTTPRKYTFGTYIKGMARNNNYNDSFTLDVIVTKTNIKFKCNRDGYGISIPLSLRVGKTYTIQCLCDNNMYPAIGISYYKEDGTYISNTRSSELINNIVNISFTIPKDTYYTLVTFYGRTNNTYNFSDIQLEEGSKANSYTPYREPISLLPYPTTLKGVGTARDTLEVVEQENRLYTLNKVVRIGEVDLGTIKFNYNTNGYFHSSQNFVTNAKKGVLASETPNIICKKYNTDSVNNVVNKPNNSISYYTYDVNNTDYLYIRDESYTDNDALKNSLSGVMLQYELATPTTEVISTDLTKDEVMALLEQGGSVEVINSNSDFVQGSTTMEMVYKKTSL